MEQGRLPATTCGPTHPNPDFCTIHICPTTGGEFDINVPSQETIDSLKKVISKKLKLSKERISLLFKDRILKDGSVAGNGLYEGCRLTLLPHVESGLISQRNENSVMQALENLTESQVNDFLSGKAPLTLAMRLGDHMMFVQLQLSTSAPGAKHRATSSSTTSSSSKSPSPSTSSTSSSRQVSSNRVASPSPSSSSSRQVSSSTSASSSLITSLPSLLSSRPAKVLPSPIPIKPTPVFPVSPSSTCSSPASSAPSSPASLSSGFSSGPPSPASSTSSFCSPLPSPVAKSPGSDSDSSQPPSPTSPTSPISMPVLDSSALAQASRNLSQKLRELSQASSHTKESREKPSTSVRSSSGAIIESMYHHGQGVFSGTFSGTLNPALQDTDGKPRRSVSTIVHILNDLLGATPQYRARMTPRSKTTHRLQTRGPRHHLLPSSSPAVRKTSRTSGEHLEMNSENRALKGKVKHIQQMLEERRRRLRARRMARSSPYPTGCWSGHNRSDTPVSMSHQPMDVDTSSTSANHADTHADSTAYTQIKQEPVMA